MSKPVKVYNRGVRPVVFKRDRTGVDAIHPGKFLTFDPDRAKLVIAGFEDACSEEDFKAITKKKKADKKKSDEVK